jgi:hypothetical protein
MKAAPLELTRAQILAHRRHVGALDERLPPGEDSLRCAAWAGLQDSMPRAALLSIHARVAGTGPAAWEDSSLVQLWGPRFSAYVVAARDIAVFSLGRLPDDATGRKAEDLATRLDEFLRGRRLPYGEVGRGLGVQPNYLRYAAPSGRVLIRWEGARQPTIWTVPPPEVDPIDARLELGRRHLHVFGPTTPASFAQWAGIKPPRALAVFNALAGSLIAVRTPVGDGWILSSDEAAFRAVGAAALAPARFLPSGDAYFLLHGADRELLVPEADRRRELWTPRVWPGALVVGGDLVGTWRRADTAIAIQTWRRLSPQERDAVAAEAESLPLPGARRPMVASWGE